MEVVTDKIVAILLNVIPLTAQNQQFVKSKLNGLLNEYARMSSE